MSRGLLLLDVDGPLNPFASSNRLRKEAGYHKYKILGFNVWLHDNHGPMLIKFAEDNELEMVWATTWEQQANEYIGWRIGLPELPVISFFNAKVWKTDTAYDFCAGKDIVWFDDDFTCNKKATDEFINKRTADGLRTFCYEISPFHGIKQDDLDECSTLLRNCNGF